MDYQYYFWGFSCSTAVAKAKRSGRRMARAVAMIERAG